MKLYSPEDGTKVNVDKEQAEIMISAGWTKSPPKKEEAVEDSDESPDASEEKPDEEKPAEVKKVTPLKKKPATVSKTKRIPKTEE